VRYVRIDIPDLQLLKQFRLTAFTECFKEFPRSGDPILTRVRREAAQLIHPLVIALEQLAMKHLAPSGRRKLPRPLSVNEAQEELRRSCEVSAPLGDARWRATVAFSIYAPLPAEEAVYICWKYGLDRTAVVVEVLEEPARDRQIVPPHHHVVALITQICPEAFDPCVTFDLLS
jgi:hypothetical protein